MLRHFLIACAIVVSGATVSAALPASALSIDDIQAQIRALLQQIDALKAQLPPQTPPSLTIGHVPPRCFDFYRNLAPGVRGDDVRELQTFLRGEGHLSAEPTGFFGPMTASAVAKWQAQEGVSAIGSFGPRSREAFKRRCGWGHSERFSATPQRGNAPLTVVFDTWLSGFRHPSVSYTIDFGDGTSERAADCPAPADACTGPGQNKHTYAQNGTYTATLHKITDPCPDDGDPNTPRCLAMMQSEVVAKQQIHVGPIACTKEYMPVCGAKPIVCVTYPCNPIPTSYSNKCEMHADGATFLYEGQCRTGGGNPGDDPQCKRWTDGKYCGKSCYRDVVGGTANCLMLKCAAIHPTPPDGPAQCLEYFSTSGKPPTISSFSGPTMLSVNQSGTWTIAASDPENQSLSYSVTWGDEYDYAHKNSASMSIAPEFKQTTTFTHSYASAGTYTVTIVVRDSSGQSAKTSTTVQVSGGSVACTMEYAPVCGRPYSYCSPTANCMPPLPQTFSNRCMMNAAGATYLYEGECGHRPQHPLTITSPTANHAVNFGYGSTVPVQWVTDYGNDYGMYLVLETANGQAIKSISVEPQAKTAALSTGTFCNNFFSDAIDGDCMSLKSRIDKGETSYRIRAAIFKPKNYCFGYCWPEANPHQLSIVAEAKSELFAIGNFIVN